jgi:hypothetical protein
MSNLKILAIVLAALQAADAAALGAQVTGFALPPAVIFGLSVAAAPIAVILVNLPAVGTIGRPQPIAD